MPKGKTNGNVELRRVEVARMVAQGSTPREIWLKLSEKYKNCTLATFKRDIEMVKKKWAEAYSSLYDLDNPRQEYEQRNSTMRDLALSEAVMDDGRMDVRNIKLASDLDKDMAKVKGVYSEKLVIQVEDAQKLIARMVDLIDSELDGDLRERLMGKLLDLTEDF